MVSEIAAVVVVGAVGRRRLVRTNCIAQLPGRKTAKVDINTNNNSAVSQLDTLMLKHMTALNTPSHIFSDALTHDCLKYSFTHIL